MTVQMLYTKYSCHLPRSRTKFAHSATLALLLTTTLLLHCTQVDAAKLSAKTATNTNADSRNSTNNVELMHAAEKTTATATVVVSQTDAIVESKAANDEDALKESVEKVDAAEKDDDNEDDDEKETDLDLDEDVDEDDDEDSTKNETSLTAAEKNEDATSAFSVWGIVRNVWHWLRDDFSENLFGDDDGDASAGAQKALVREVRDVSEAAKAAVESRTFGKIRRLQMAIIPLIFKFGVLTAMVAFLIMLGMKTLFLVKLLVLMNAAAILAKFITLKANFGGHEHSAPTWNYQTWTPHATGGWAASAPGTSYSHSSHEHQPTKEIHLHIHGGQVHGYGGGSQGVLNGGGGHGGWESRSDPYGAYAPTLASEAENELDNLGPVAMLPTRYPPNPNHNYQ
ncbi:uncharacterized protein LOC101448449 [Ceratitis capitata]|uniref:uncharacterized protein LOC101448449 n=1 Tax=Ceratitis capitata TaxID=7213 RepID=UPI0006188152|nr:uncharacterized protein LOC101448449 [Ceratitis capitata]